LLRRRSLRRIAAVFLVLAVLFPASRAIPAGLPDSDALFREGVELLVNEEYPAARERFAAISAEEYDLGDYLLYFSGLSLAREGRRDEASEVRDRLASLFPDSPLLPDLSRELAFAAVKADDLDAARKEMARSRGKASGNGRAAEEGYIAARLLETEEALPENPAPDPSADGNVGEARGEAAAAEEDPGPPGRPAAARFRPTPEAARAHLKNFSDYTVQEGASLSMERLWTWRSNGMLSSLPLGGEFYGRFAGALFRAGDSGKARTIYQQAVDAHPPPEEYYPILLDYAEFLRKQGDTVKAKALLDGAVEGAPASFRAEVDFLSARVDWKAGRTPDARGKFLEIAGRGDPPEIAERSRYQAAWIYLEEENLPAATEEFGKLAAAGDEQTRRESIFRHAFGLYRQKRYEEAISAFEAGEKLFDSPVEQARHAYWRGRALEEAGEEERGKALFETLSADPAAGPFALVAALRLGRDPFAMFSAPSSGETVLCEQETETLWERIRAAKWSAEDAVRVRRAERLVRLGLTEYAVLEAERVPAGEVRRVLGVSGGRTPAVFRYLAGDLRGAILDTVGLADGRGPVGLMHRLQYPLAPQYVGNCDEKKSGVDPLVLHAIIRQESLFQYNALSPAGAVGLMQLMPGTARRIARGAGIRGRLRKQDLLRPERNVALGAYYLSTLLSLYGGDYLRAVAAYNAGESAVARWWGDAGGDPALFLERVAYRETRGYLRKVFFNLLQYYRIYRPEMFARYVPTAPREETQAPGASGTPPGEGTHASVPDPVPPPAQESPAVAGSVD